ncbi:protein red1 [Naviculisporaceae sp. PSN 640]
MSQYPPPNGYGQYYGQPPSQQYGYPLPPNYLVPPFGQPFNPAIGEAASNAVQSSFNFNANHIPGLGIAGGQGPISHPIVPGLPAAGDLTQASPLPKDNSFNQNQTTRTTAPLPKNPVTRNSYPAMNNDIEEGELNEEQFEDLYEPQESVEQIPNVRARPKPPSSANDSGVVSAADTPEAGFYGNDEDDSAMSANKKPGAPASRERSGSYSPFLSPRGSPPNMQTSQLAAPNSTEASQDGGKNSQAVPGLHVSSQPSRNGPTELASAQPALEQQSGRYSFKSVEEYRKEAQKAILRLWPLGVRFQQYIDEGFDEELIKSLFKQLNLNIKDAQSSQPDKVTASKPAKLVEKQQTQKTEPTLSTKPQTMASGDSKNGEERKNRIARLLAEKAAKPPAPPAQAKPQPKRQPPKAPEKKDVPFSPPKAPAAMTRSKAWGEKEILLQQKIAALHEAQARKAAKGKSSSGQVQVPGTGTGPAAVKPVPAVVKAPTGPSKVAEKPANPTSASSIPGLLLSSIPTGPARNQRKRPVASDFVDIPPATQPNKRPFGQHRKDTSLVIDVSEASGDEEMDIDAESPLEDSSSSQFGGLPAQRGPAIRDFPPLTDTPPQRQFSSPAPSSNTPLGHTILSKKRETELDIKEKEIQEMRRKIAEAEARRKAKQSSGGPLTPTQAGQSPESKDIEQTSGSDREASAHLPSTATSAPSPKKSDMSRPSQKIERRGRIVSLDLPRIDETIEEKRNRLKQLREEEMRLQAEIDNELARKKLLTEELDQLGEASSDDARQANGLDDTSGVPTPVPNETPDGPQTTSGAVSTVSEHDEAHVDVSMDEDDSSADEHTPETAETHEPKSTEIAGPVEAETFPVTDTEVPAPAEVASQVTPDDSGANDMIGSTRSGPALDTTVSGASDQDVNPAEIDDDLAPMEIESSSPSPSLDLAPASNEVVGDDVQATNPVPDSTLDQLSTVTKPREAVQEIEAQPTREDNANSKQQSKTGFKPYESPLRYFRAYRFHPNYSETVRGGLKSLTYSNSIDPQKTFCPSELAGQQCPADCKFQHLRSIGTPGDRILLELGTPDEYSGEQRTRFIHGLRKLLSDIRETGRGDFDAIAREIIAFRSRFLGDPSKVLPLGGVTL